jgi:hypothetical protein
MSASEEAISRRHSNLYCRRKHQLSPHKTPYTREMPGVPRALPNGVSAADKPKD